MRLVLASASPRRRELLQALDTPFEVAATDVDETSTEDDAERLVLDLALRKARAACEGAPPQAAPPEAVYLGADTVVVLDGRVLGKPVDAADARQTLRALRSREHQVISGVAVVTATRHATAATSTAVTMRGYADSEIEEFIGRGVPFDKAGSYAIQDERFAPVSASDGCVCSVIGLPLWSVRELLATVAGLRVATPRYERCASCPGRDTGTQ